MEIDARHCVCSIIHDMWDARLMHSAIIDQTSVKLHHVSKIDITICQCEYPWITVIQIVCN